MFGLQGGHRDLVSKAHRRTEGNYVGVLVLSNFGQGEDLTIMGVPVGMELFREKAAASAPPGSIVVVLATDAPLSDRQLGRVARRCQGGLARVGSVFSNGSGDFVVAFSNAERVGHRGSPRESALALRDDSAEMAGIFRAAQEATEEAVVNVLFASDTMVGRDGNIRQGLPLSETREILRRYGAL